jgi:hypothetical protein
MQIEVPFYQQFFVHWKIFPLLDVSGRDLTEV